MATSNSAGRDFAGDVVDESLVTDEEARSSNVAGRDRIEKFLRELGAEDGIIHVVKRRAEDVDVQRVVQRFRRFAQENPAVILGALSAIILGGAVAGERAVKSAKARRSGAKSTKRSAPSNRARTSSKERASSPSKKRSSSSKRTLIEPHAGDKRYVRRDAEGHFKKEVNVGRSLAADRRSKSKTAAPKGQGDRGDFKR
jgi:hypothetical protein